MSPRSRLMTREEFDKFLARAHVHIYVAPAEIVECRCGDVNCHGWRLVPDRTRGAVQQRDQAPLRRTT